MHKKYGIFIKKEKIFTENGLYAQLRAYKWFAIYTKSWKK
jgi:hypothetical protein